MDAATAASEGAAAFFAGQPSLEALSENIKSRAAGKALVCCHAILCCHHTYSLESTVTFCHAMLCYRRNHSFDSTSFLGETSIKKTENPNSLCIMPPPPLPPRQMQLHQFGNPFSEVQLPSPVSSAQGGGWGPTPAWGRGPHPPAKTGQVMV